MRMRSIALSIVSLVVLSASADARCLAYEPKSVTLTGEIEMRKLPGPPNYRSVARGDRPETVYFLKLAEVVCVSGDPTRRLNSKSHAGIGEIQLILSAVKGSAAVGKEMRVTGTLSGAQSAHHRTPVLLTVKAMRPSK